MPGRLPKHHPRRVRSATAVVDLAAALALTNDDCVFELTEPAPDGDRFVVHAAISAGWKPVFDDVTSHFTVEDSFTAGSRVVQRWRYDSPCTKWAGQISST
jgi:SnoaL-like domain